MFTQEDLLNLKEALVSGASTVTVGGRSITYRSKKELLELIKIVQDELAGNDPSVTENTSTIIASFDKKGRRC